MRGGRLAIGLYHTSSSRAMRVYLWLWCGIVCSRACFLHGGLSPFGAVSVGIVADAFTRLRGGGVCHTVVIGYIILSSNPPR